MRVRAFYCGEQIGRYNGPKSRRWLKREARRKERQNARRLGEDAPICRRYSGWGD